MGISFVKPRFYGAKTAHFPTRGFLKNGDAIERGTEFQQAGTLVYANPPLSDPNPIIRAGLCAPERI
jgi:hypothetical protein